MANSETRRFDYKRRELARCKACKKGYQRQVRVVGTATTYYHLGMMSHDSQAKYFADDGQELRPTTPVLCEGCGRSLIFKTIKGRVVAEIKCNSKCTGATGPNCECSCGGKNHGGGLSSM